jgi:hypothetical protein
MTHASECVRLHLQLPLSYYFETSLYQSSTRYSQVLKFILASDGVCHSIHNSLDNQIVSTQAELFNWRFYSLVVHYCTLLAIFILSFWH